MNENKSMNDDKNIMSTYKRFNIKLTEGKGNRVVDSNGKEYLDFVAGIAVMNLGHGNKKVLEAIKNQSEKLMQCSNLFYSDPQIEFADLLIKNSFGDKVFFCNSGAEANEAALKLSRKYAQNKNNTSKYKILTMKNSFHGRTVATLTATGQDKYHQGFGPLWTGFEYIEFNNVEDLVAKFNDEICALVIEPIQGEGGVVEVTEEFMKKARELCDKFDTLLIFDEIQCGLGRSGKLFAHEHYGVKPDIMTLSKALGGGLPMGCCIATEAAASAFKYGDHGSTFGGNPISAAAGKAAFEVLLEENLTENAYKAGLSFNKKLNELKSVHSVITEIRGKGLMVGLQLNVPAEAYVNKCHELGLLVCQAGPNVIRFLPPLTVTEAEIVEAVGILNKAFYDVK